MVKKKVLLVSLLVLFAVGFASRLLIGESPQVGEVVLWVGVIGFVLMVISSIMLKREQP